MAASITTPHMVPRDDWEKPSTGEQTTSILVTWSMSPDPENPRDWSPSRKWTNVIVLSIQGILVPMATTLPAVAAPAIATDFGTSSAIAPALPVALFILGLGTGPLYVAPLSELYGRRATYVASFATFALLNVGCALAPDLATLSVLRFLAGMAGCAGPGLGGASIGDMFAEGARGKAQALYGLGPTAGPVLGGALGGFILDGTGSWRWLMWIMAIAPAATALACLVLLRETYAPVLLRARAKKLRRLSPHLRFHTDYDDTSVRSIFLLSITRPMRMLVRSPVCASLAVYIAMVYGIFYLYLISLSLLFSPNSQYGLFTYAWTGGKSGLSFFGVGVGILVGTFVSIRYSTRIYEWRNIKTAAKRKALAENRLESATVDSSRELETTTPEEGSPENRLFLLQIGMFVIPLGLIMYAWSAGRTHWVVPLLGAAIFAVGMMMAYVAFQTYIVDTFGRFAASALAASIVLRSIAGCLLTMFGLKMYGRLGYDWGTMLLAFLCIGMIPIPFVLSRFGPSLRKKEFVF